MSSSALKSLPIFDASDSRESSRIDFANLTEFDAGDMAALASSASFDMPLEPDADVANVADPSSEPETDSAVDLSIQCDIPSEPDIAPAEPVPATVPNPEVAPSTATAPVVNDADVQGLVSELSQALQAARAEMQTQINAALNEMVETLLPALGREFLCDEVARHIPNLIPDRIFGVEIAANPVLAEKLEALFEQDGAIPANAIIRPMPGKATGSISINWGEGGYDFEFEPMLARCRQRLGAKQSD